MRDYSHVSVGELREMERELLRKDEKEFTGADADKLAAVRRQIRKIESVKGGDPWHSVWGLPG